MPSERQGVSAPAGSAAVSTGAKWGKRASMDPFAASDSRVQAEFSTDDDVKENTAPTNATTQPRKKSLGIVMTPTMVRRRSTGGRDGDRSAVAIVNVISKQNTVNGARGNANTIASLLGKRPRGPSPTRPANLASGNKMRRLSSAKDDDDEDDVPATQRTLFTNEDETLDDDGKPRNVMVVNDFVRVGELVFGAVAVGQRKSLLLTLQNPSQVGNARVKYEGYVMSTATREQLPKQTMDSRFKCDLDVCTVPAEGKVTLRITFEPKEQDVNQDLVAMLKFTVNDRFSLQCEVSGSGVPDVVRAISLRERITVAQGTAKTRRSLDSVAFEPASDERQAPQTPTKEHKAVTYPVESVISSGVKRRESVALVVSPPRHPKTKKMRLVSDDREYAMNPSGDIVVGASAATGGFQGSWWEKRKTLSDEEWMQRQEEGFTKWMNFVLVDSTGEDNEVENALGIIEHPHRATPRGRKRRNRIDFSSLRVLAMKRMESMWSRAAMEIYRSDEVTEVAANLKNEIGEGKLLVRRDRPAYADVGLQEELIELLNNYHPVWLCLALETVLGHQIMAQEKCSLRSVMTYCANLAEKNAARKKDEDSTKSGATSRMPRHLRRVIVQHVIHDHQVAKRYRLVKNLKTPVESGGTLRAGKANPKISGREYFDALMDSFVFKFFMIVLLLDRAAALRSDKFTRFPCLFRVQPVKSKKVSIEGDMKHIKNSQGIVTEFCRLFLSKEGRIDRHMAQLGYLVSFRQVPLDEVDLRITNIAVDLRDGVRLTRLLETLTVSPGAKSLPSQKALSSSLRVPAPNRTLKVHNVELCLNFMLLKCGRDFLESIRTSIGQVKTASSGALRDKEDAKLIETMAKSVVDGHRERTLALLWKLISVFQLRSLVNVERLTKEIENIKQRMSFRSLEFYESAHTRLAPRSATEENQGLDEDVRELLLEWCRVVCANYFVRVVDFSDSFADGRALCYLLHFYHPMLLTKSEIRVTTAEYASSSTRAIHSRNDITKALEYERRHFTLVNERVKQLGEVPVLLPEQYDSMNPPDEKVIVTFVCYLQSRLMDSSREIHAAARLKRWWLSPRIRWLMRHKKNRAARVIQRFWYTSSVKRLAIRRCRRLLKAGRMVASYMCAWFDRSRFLRLRCAVVALQRGFRSRMAGSSSSVSKLVAAVKVQRSWRCHSLRQCVQTSISKRKICKRIVQEISASRIKHLLQLNVEQKRDQREALRVYQEMLEKQRFESGKKALLKKVHTRCARIIQHAARTFLTYRHHNIAATKLQASWRRFSSRSHFLRERNASVLLQTAVRRWLKRRQAEAMERFRAMLAEQDRERRSKVLRAKVEHRNVSFIQQSWRSFVIQRQHKAATTVQSLVRGVLAKKLLDDLKNKRDHCAAVIIQKQVRRMITQRRYKIQLNGITHLQAIVRGVSYRTNVLNFARFHQKAKIMRVKMAKWKVEVWTNKIACGRIVKRTAATNIQKTWRMHAIVKEMNVKMQSATRIQALVRGVQSRQYVFNFAVFRAKTQHTRVLIAAWTIARWSKNQLARYREKRYDGAVVIQASVRSFFTRKHFLMLRRAAMKIQSRVRGMISRENNLNFYIFKWRAAASRKRIALWCIQSWIMRCVQIRRCVHAATMIQKNARMYTTRKRFVAARSAATKIQSRFRGKLYREYVFDYGMFKATQMRCRKKMAVWKLQAWMKQIVVAERVKTASAVCIQANVRCVVARTQYVKMRQAAVLLQKIVRGVQSRRHKHNHAVFRKQINRTRVLCAVWKIQLWIARRVKVLKAQRSALVRAKWTKVSYTLLRSRLEAVDSIARSWSSYCLRQTIRTRVEWTAVRMFAATDLQRWWRGIQMVRAARHELHALRFQRAKKMQREQAEHAATRIQVSYRTSMCRSQAKRSRQCLVKMREYYAAVRIKNSVFHRLVLANREKRSYVGSVQRIQSWWRGMLVRLREKRQAVTEQRKKLATMTLVTPDHPSMDKPHTELSTHDPSKPLTLGARLEMALHMLLHGKRLQDMLFASHTIEMCTRYSRECAWKCVQLKISNTIFAAIRGLNRSRPHVELLHQLLLVLVNLTSYQRKESKNYTAPTVHHDSDKLPVDQDDLRAVDALVDLIHVHRDMHVIFVLASRILKHYLLVIKPHTSASKEVFSQWSETHRRLRALHELLYKKMQVAAWTSKLPATPSKVAANNATPNATNPNTNVMAKINPKTAVSVVAQLLKVIE